MWQVKGKQVVEKWLNVEPVRVLYDFDGPRIFVCKDVPGINDYLAYQCGEEPGKMRFLVVPFSEHSERKLTNGELNLHDALMRPRAWIFDLDYQWNVTGSWEIQVENLPPRCVPQPGVMLWSHLPPRIKEASAIFCATETIIPLVVFGDNPTMPYFSPTGAA